MGMNTVAFIHNDLMDSIERSPKATIYGLTNPPLSDSDEEKEHWRKLVNMVADESGEPRLHPQALRVLATFHASTNKFFMATGNAFVEFEPDDWKLVTRNGTRYAMVKLPPHMQKKESHV